MVLKQGLAVLTLVLGFSGLAFFYQKPKQAPPDETDPRVSLVYTASLYGLALADTLYDKARAKMEVKPWNLPPVDDSIAAPGPPRIAFLAWGSRGDMQPVVALTFALQRAGVAVRLHIRPLEEAFVRSFGLDVVADLEDDIEGMRLIFTDGQPLRHLYESLRAYRPQLILYSLPTAGEAWILEEQLGVPTMFYNLMPVPNQPEIWRGRLSALRIHFDIGLGKRTLVGFQEAQATERLTRRPRLLAYSPELFYTPPPHWTEMLPGVPPQPKDIQDPIGHWMLKQEDFPTGSEFFGGQPEAAVRTFLAAGSTPVYIGWGSMEGEPTSEAKAKLAVSALKKAGRRGIILGGGAKLRRELLEVAGAEELLAYADANVLWLTWAPHEWLLPLCSLAVHHGGAGTIAAVHRAGLPSVVTPHSLDQFLWGPAVAEKGVGVSTEALQKLQADELAEGILKCEDDNIKRAAAELGKKMREEDGVSKAVEVITGFLKSLGH